jgi:hypothetical protein
MKATRAAARQASAIESTSEQVQQVIARLAAVEAKLDALIAAQATAPEPAAPEGKEQTHARQRSR